MPALNHTLVLDVSVCPSRLEVLKATYNILCGRIYQVKYAPMKPYSCPVVLISVVLAVIQ